MLRFKNIWEVAYPIILGMIAQNLINLIDTAFLGRLGEVELGAAAIGGLFYYVLFMLGFGFGTGAQILISRRNGEKRYKEIGKLTDQTLFFLLVFSIIVFLFVHYFSQGLLDLIVSSDRVGQAANSYLSIRNYGIIFAFLNVGARAFFVGITRTRILSYGAIVMAIVNIVLDYALIFGHFGLPAMGIEGAALASVIAEGAAVVFFMAYVKIKIPSEQFSLFRFKSISFTAIGKILDVSIYVMLQYFISIAGWFYFFLVIEQTGEHNLAISNIIRSIYMILIIPVFGFGTAANTLVSNSIGRDGPVYVRRIIWKTVTLTMLSSIVIMGISLMMPQSMIALYTDNQKLLIDSIPALYVVIWVLPIFSVSVVVFSGISGTGNTGMALLIEVGTIMLYLFFVYYFAISLQWSIDRVWFSEYVYSSFLGLFSIIYLYSGHWKKKQI